MKNIHDILKDFEIEIPAEKKEAFDKAVVENYKTVKELASVKEKLEAAEKDRDAYKEKYDNDIAQRDTDLESLKTQLAEAGQSKDKLNALQTSLTEAQEKYNNDKAAWEKQLADQQYAFSINEATRDLNFSSKAARKVFIDELIANPLQMKDGAILGFNDYVDVYKESNPDSFVVNDEGEGAGNNPHFSSRTGGEGAKPEEKDDKDKGGETEFVNPVIW